MIGLSIAAVAFGQWCSSLLVPSGTVPAAEVAPLLDLIRWIPPVLVGSPSRGPEARSAGSSRPA